MTKTVEVVNLVKRYQKAEKNAVDGISFSIEKGEFFAFLGPNGAGKTTTISILATMLKKTSGEVRVAGYDVDRESSQVRRKIGIIFQNPSLDRNLTAEENVRFHAILYGLYPFAPSFGLMDKDYQKKVKELTEVLGIEKEVNKPIKSFSGGMKRKLEIVRSLMHDPEVLFLDEPTSGLDPLSRRNLWDYLKEVRRKRGTTVLLTTHYLDEAEGAERVCVINHGKVVEEGKPESIKHRLTRQSVWLKAEKKEELVIELKKLGYEVGKQGKETEVFVDQTQVQELIQKMKVKLLGVRTHVPTLEEAYLNLIGKEEG